MHLHAGNVTVFHAAASDGIEILLIVFGVASIEGVQVNGNACRRASDAASGLMLQGADRQPVFGDLPVVENVFEA